MRVDDTQKDIGIDIPIPTLGLTLRQPRLKEISMIGEVEYFTALMVMALTAEKLKISEEATNWDIFQQVLDQPIQGIENPRALIRNFIQLFFPGKVNFGPRSIMIENNGEMVNISGSDFDLVQSLILEVGGHSLVDQESEKEQFNPQNARAAAIAEKMKKGRERIAKQKAEGTKKTGMFRPFIKIVSLKTNNSFEDIGNMTIHQLVFLAKSYLDWEDYDTKVKSAMAGAKLEGGLHHWTVERKEDLNIGTI